MATVSDTGICREGAIVPPRGLPSYRHVGCHRALRGLPSYRHVGRHRTATWVAVVPSREVPSHRLRGVFNASRKTNSFSSFPAAFFPSVTVVTIANIFMLFIYRFFAQLFLHRIKDKPDTNKQQSNRFNNSDNSQKSILTPNKRDGIYRREVCKASRPLASLKITFKISARSASNAVKT